jgi:8-oxo-dGTP diphosphatase
LRVDSLARRELIEETALAVDGFTFLFEFGGLTKRHHVFLTDLPDNLTPAASNEISRCRWTRPKQLSNVITSVPTREIVRLLIGHKNVTIALPGVDLEPATASSAQTAV